MTVTEFGTNDPLTRKVWAKRLYHGALERTFMKSLMGTSEDAILQRVVDLERTQGDVVHYSFLADLSGAGVDGDTDLDGNEEAMVFHRASVGIDQKRNGVRFKRMSMQRHVNDLRRSGRIALEKWYARIYDRFVFSYLAGFANENVSSQLSSTAESSFAGNALLSPNAANFVNHATETLHGKATDGAEDSSIDHITEAVTMAMTADPIVEPGMFGGVEAYVYICHPYALHNLRIETGATKWSQIVAQARERSKEHPIFQRAVGMWGNAIIMESNNIPHNSTTDVTHNVLLGRGAGVIAFGNAYSRLDQKRVPGGSTFSWFEELKDYGNTKSIGVGSIFGIQKNQFNSVDFGVIKVAADDAPPVATS